MKYFLLPVIATLLTACASSTTTLPTTLPSHTLMKEGGLFQTSGYGLVQDDSEKSATFNANQSCSMFKKTPLVTKIESKYQGTVGEDVNKTVNMVSGILKSVTGKNYGTTATDKDYKTTLEFRCQ